MIPLVLMPEARPGRPALAARAAADPARVYVERSLTMRRQPYLFARGEKTVRIGNTMARLILFLAAQAAVYVPLEEITDAVWGDREDGGPDAPVRQIHVIRSQQRGDLAALGLRLFSRGSRGLELVLLPPGNTAPPAVLRSNRGAPHAWIDRAAELRLAGMTWAQVNQEIRSGLHQNSVSQAVLVAHPELYDIPRRPPAGAKGGRMCGAYRDPSDLSVSPYRLKRMKLYREQRRAAAVHSIS